MKSKLLPSHVYGLLFVVAFILGSHGIAVAGTETVLHQFVNLARGGFPASTLIADSEGNYYGTTSVGGTYGFGTVFKLTKTANNWQQTVLYNFTGLADGNNAVSYESGGLVMDKFGNLFGTTSQGGGNTCLCGVVYELSPGPNGRWTQTVLHSFAGGPADGAGPTGPLVLDGQGNLYGTTEFGGQSIVGVCPSSCGTVFELVRSNGGWTENILYMFSGKADGANPIAGLVLDSNDHLFGVTSAFSDLLPTVFELARPAGVWKLKTLLTFHDGTYPNGLALDGAGNLYGSSAVGGVNDGGQVFQVQQVGGGWSESIIYSFASGSDGFTPIGNVIVDASGNLYGTTNQSASGTGNVFMLSPSGGGTWTETTLYAFKGGSDGANPQGGLLLDSAGNILGTTYRGGAANAGSVFELVSTSGVYSESLLFSFPPTDGARPVGNLVADSAGNLYGTTANGGIYDCPIVGNGCGSIFKLTHLPDGTWQRNIIHNFSGTLNGDGAGPTGGLIFDSAGNLFGTTSNSIYGGGTAFELSPSGGKWIFHTIYSFSSHRNDGNDPIGNLVMDAAGNLYGTTIGGGTGSPYNCSYCGTVFKLTPTGLSRWKETIIYNFQGLSDGNLPEAGLALDAAGNLYGTTSEGGIYPGDQGCGVAFKLASNPDGTWTQSVVYTFAGTSDGCGPLAGVVLDSAGNLYGTAPSGGTGGPHCNFGCGVVYKLTPTPSGPWTESTIYNFGGMPDGAYPRAGLTFDAAGNLYGTTNGGGSSTNPYCSQGCGTLFKLTPSGGSWSESVLYNFAGPTTDGGQPSAGVILDSAGNIYGTASIGGINGTFYQAGGTVFEMSQ
jgi:uncharacterized repeat protein (TIGR03803 family)